MTKACYKKHTVKKTYPIMWMAPPFHIHCVCTHGLQNEDLKAMWELLGTAGNLSNETSISCFSKLSCILLGYQRWYFKLSLAMGIQVGLDVKVAMNEKFSINSQRVVVCYV